MQKPLLSLIWAMDRNRLIGNNNALPWHLPADFAWFKQQTLGKPILMGRKTYESIGRPLPGRTNLILSRQPELAIEGCQVVGTLEAALEAVGDCEELMVIGGAEIYRMLLPHADRLYITEVDGAFEGDTWFPEFDRSAWRELSRQTHAADEKNAYDCTFMLLERNHH